MRYRYILISFLLFLIGSNLAAQSFDPDQLLVEARDSILAGKYIEGRKIAFRALEKYPNYADILILVGRSYAWEGKNDSASIYLERAIVASPEYEDAYSAFLDNLMWGGDYDRGKEVVQIAKEKFSVYPNSLAYKEARLLYFAEEYDAAYEKANSLFKSGYDNKEILGFMRNLQRLRSTNAVGFTYDYDTYFGDITPWNTVSVYGRTRTKLTGSIIARVIQTWRFDDSGVLFELDAYPSLWKKAYAYVNVGGSGASFFPDFRFGLSIYQNLPKAWEVEAGYRHLQFTELTQIYVVGLGKYVGNWWLHGIVNIIPSDDGAGVSGNFQARYYFRSAEDFFSFQIGSGVSPDEETRDQSQLLNSYRVRLGYQELIKPRFMIFGYTGFSRDELNPDQFRNNLNLSIGAEYRF